MRTLLLPLLMASMPVLASGPAKMSVVVHTTDRVVVQYVCPEKSDAMALNVVATELQSSGMFRWHVVGGVAPFTVVRDQAVPGKGRCITVRDAEGNEASACGIVDQITSVRYVPCTDHYNYDEATNSVSGIAPNDSTDAARTGDYGPLPPPTPPTTPTTPTPLGPPVDHAGPPLLPGASTPEPAIPYRPPVKIPEVVVAPDPRSGTDPNTRKPVIDRHRRYGPNGGGTSAPKPVTRAPGGQAHNPPAAPARPVVAPRPPAPSPAPVPRAPVVPARSY